MNRILDIIILLLFSSSLRLFSADLDTTQNQKLNVIENERSEYAKKKDINGILKTYLDQSNVYLSLNYYSEADSIIDLSIKIYHSYESPILADLYFNLGVSNTNLAKYEKALKSYNKATEIAEKNNNDELYYLIQSRIAEHYRRINKIDEAIRIESNVYEFFQDTENEQVGKYASDLGYLYLYKIEDDFKYLDSSRKYLSRTLDYAIEKKRLFSNC